jgi:hypothetical protein
MCTFLYLNRICNHTYIPPSVWLYVNISTLKYIYIYIYINISHTYVHVYIQHTQLKYFSSCSYEHAGSRVIHVYECLYVSTYLCTLARTCMYVCMYLCKHIHAHKCMCIYMIIFCCEAYMYFIFTNTHMRINIFMYALWSQLRYVVMQAYNYVCRHASNSVWMNACDHRRANASSRTCTFLYLNRSCISYLHNVFA